MKLAAALVPIILVMALVPACEGDGVAPVWSRSEDDERVSVPRSGDDESDRAYDSDTDTHTDSDIDADTDADSDTDSEEEAR